MNIDNVWTFNTLLLYTSRNFNVQVSEGSDLANWIGTWTLFGRPILSFSSSLSLILIVYIYMCIYIVCQLRPIKLDEYAFCNKHAVVVALAQNTHTFTCKLHVRVYTYHRNQNSLITHYKARLYSSNIIYLQHYNAEII